MRARRSLRARLARFVGRDQLIVGAHQCSAIGRHLLALLSLLGVLSHALVALRGVGLLLALGELLVDERDAAAEQDEKRELNQDLPRFFTEPGLEVVAEDELAARQIERATAEHQAQDPSRVSGHEVGRSRAGKVDVTRRRAAWRCGSHDTAARVGAPPRGGRGAIGSRPASPSTSNQAATPPSEKVDACPKKPSIRRIAVSLPAGRSASLRHSPATCRTRCRRSPCIAIATGLRETCSRSRP